MFSGILATHAQHDPCLGAVFQASHKCVMAFPALRMGLYDRQAAKNAYAFGTISDSYTQPALDCCRATAKLPGLIASDMLFPLTAG